MSRIKVRMPALAVAIAAAIMLGSAGVLGQGALAPFAPGSAFAAESGTQTAETPDVDNTVNMNQLPDSSFLYDTDIATLNAADGYHDSQTVQVRGQAVGDLIADETDPQRCWVTLQEESDHPTAVISVSLTREQATLIDTLGRYGVQGTIIQVRGQYHLDCDEHQGLSDIHADEVTRLDKGKETPVALHPALVAAAIAFLLIGVVLHLVYRHRLDRSK